MPSKQKIGKQRRKERKKQQKADDRRNGIVRNVGNNNSTYYRRSECRRRGVFTSTEIQKGLARNFEEPRFGLDRNATFLAFCRKKLSTDLYEHLALSILSFLNRCEKETFSYVSADVGREIPSPSIWITILLGVVHYDENEDSNSSLQIAENIGPLARCMCADTKCLFFKSNEHWEDSIVEFADLVRTIIINTSIRERGNPVIKQKTVDALLQHPGLLSSVVQWCFWDNEHRPDIWLKLGAENCTKIVDFSRAALESLILSEAIRAQTQGQQVAEYGKRWLKQLGATPIVSKKHDPSCNVSCVAGLILILESSRDDSRVDDVSILRPRLNCLTFLVEGVDCVDKGVITEIIKLGNKITNDSALSLVHAVARWAFGMLLQDTDTRKTNQYTDMKGHPSDSRVAAAVRSGLVEMCFNLITCFGCHESFCSGAFLYMLHRPSLSLFKYIESILKAVHHSSFDNKTWKAIRHKKDEIELELVRLEQNADISSNANCQSLLDMIRSIINLNGTYCCRCNKLLEKKAIKQCDGCNCMVYCSEACQRDDWLNGHKLSCSKPYAEENGCQFQGRIYPRAVPENERDVAKLEDLEIKMTSIQLKLFLDHSERILLCALIQERSKISAISR